MKIFVAAMKADETYKTAQTLLKRLTLVTNCGNLLKLISNRKLT